MELLADTHHCHTVLLYGSRARGEATATSDYDVAGICSQGDRTRICRRVDGHYWDLFIYAESDLRRLGDQQRAWKDARLLRDTGGYGKRLMSRLGRFLASPAQPAPSYEIEASRTWSLKQLERCRLGDVHGDYRRLELQVAALNDYFTVRQLPYPGPKAALAWLETRDPECSGLFERVYRNPLDREALEALVGRVYKVAP